MDPENQFSNPDGTPGESLDELNLWSDDHVCDSSPDLVSFIEEILIPPNPTSEENSTGVNNVAMITATANTTAPRRRRCRKRKEISENVESGEESSTAASGKYKKSKKSHGEGTSRTYEGVNRYSSRFGAFKWDPINPKKETVYLGGYDVERDAARAYDLAAPRFSRKTAETNFPSANHEKDLEEMESLDRREYLRATKRKCNAYVRGSSKFRGVSRNPDTGRWQAKLGKGKDRKGIYLGVFDTEKEAARAYDVAAIKLLSANSPTNYPRNRYKVEEIMKSDKFLIREGASKLIRRHSVKDLLLMKQRRKNSAAKDVLQMKQRSKSPENELPVTKSSVNYQPEASSSSGEQVVPPLHDEGNVVRRAVDEDYPSKVTTIFQEMCPFVPPQTLPSLPNLDFQLQNNPYFDSQIQPQYSNYAVPDPPQMGSGLFPKLAGAPLEVQPSDRFVSIFGLDEQNPLFNQSPTDANQYLQQQQEQVQGSELIDILNFSKLQDNNGMQFNSDSAKFHPGSGYANLDMLQQQQLQQQVPDSHFNSSSAIFNPSLGFASQYMQQQLIVPDSPYLFGLSEEEADQFLESFLNKNGGLADIGSDNHEGLASNADNTCNFLFNQLDMVQAGTTTNQGLDNLEPIGP